MRPRIQQSAIDARVARRAHRLRSAIIKTGALYSPDALHRVRIAVKKLRYALEVAQKTAGRDDPGIIKALKQAQERLGRLNDLEVFIGRARKAQIDADIDLVSELTALAEDADVRCRELHAEFMRDRPALIDVAVSLCRPQSVRSNVPGLMPKHPGVRTSRPSAR